MGIRCPHFQKFAYLTRPDRNATVSHCIKGDIRNHVRDGKTATRHRAQRHVGKVCQNQQYDIYILTITSKAVTKALVAASGSTIQTCQ